MSSKKDIKFECRYIKKCGGCNMLDKTYQQQLQEKKSVVQKLLKPYVKVEEIIGMENPLHYRNKVHAVFSQDKKGNIISGVYEEGTHRVVAVDKCLIENEKADEIIQTIRLLLPSFKLKAYDEDKRQGFLRHVLIRTGHITGEIMVVLVTGTHMFPSKNNFVKALLKEHPEITTIVMNINDKKTSMVLGEKEQVLYGKGYIVDELCGKKFKISPKSFYQVNSVQTKKLYEKAIEFAQLKGNERVFDAYCGIGTIGIIASDYAKEVIGVELNKDAVKDAIVNAKLNNIKKVRFYQKDAGLFMREMAAKHEKVDVLLMDPPRAGSDQNFLNSTLTLSPEKIVYISCNPETLVRDLKYLTRKGYTVKKAIAVDMFPGTSHIEVCVKLERK